MENFVRRMIEEHKALNNNISKLTAFLLDKSKVKKVTKEEFGLMNSQLTGMVSYRNALANRLELHNIIITPDCNYYENVTNEPEKKDE